MPREGTDVRESEPRLARPQVLVAGPQDIAPLGQQLVIEGVDPVRLHRSTMPRAPAPSRGGDGTPPSAQNRSERGSGRLECNGCAGRRPLRRSACGRTRRSATGRPGCGRPRRSRHRGTRRRGARIRAARRPPPAAPRPRHRPGAGPSTTKARSMSDEGKRLTAPPAGMRRGTRSSSKSRPRSTSSQPIRRAVVPLPDGRVRSNRTATAGSISPTAPTVTSSKLPARAMRCAERVGCRPGSGGVPSPGGIRRTPSRRSESARTCQAATAERTSSSSLAKTAERSSRSPGSSARSDPPAPLRSTTRANPAPGCEKTTPTSNSRTSGCRRLAL